MRNFALVFGAVVIVSLCAAAIGHAYCPEFCIAFKPMAWPFVALAAYAGRKIFYRHRRD